MKTRILVFTSLLTIAFFIGGPFQTEGAQFINGDAQIEGYINNELIRIIVSTTKYFSNYPYQTGLLWGVIDEDEKPFSVISNIEISIKNRKLFVPLSAYSDLANPYEILLRTDQNSFTLIIDGGDTGTSYFAELYFVNSEIKHRKVYHKEFPDEVWEKTEYSFIQDRGQ